MPHTCSVLAREPWNDTGIDLRIGQEYRFDYQSDPDQPWKDATLVCDPVTGHDFWLTKPMKRFCRVRGQDYFVLIGCLDQDYATCFPVFQHRDLPYRPHREGRLWVFANDVAGFYWNNHGRITLTVRR